MLPAWQLLLAHSLHAVGSMLAGLHADQLLPGVSQQQQQQQQWQWQQQQQGGEASVSTNQEAPAVLLPVHPEAVDVLCRVQLVLEFVGPQLTELQGCSLAATSTAAAAAAAAAGGSSSKVDPLLWLLQQHTEVNKSFRQLVAAADAGSSSGSDRQQELRPGRVEYRDAMGLLVSLRSAVPAALAQQLVDFAAGLSGRFPAKLACNAPGCSSLAWFSELEAVGGKSCMCAKCRTAR
jgi:hypothetical protein